MLAHGISNLLNFFKRSLSAVHFQQGLEALESLHSSLPGPFRYGDEIGSPRRRVARGPIWVGDPHRDAFKFTLAHFPGNDGVQTDVVDYDESPGTPANRASGYQLELGCHRLFFATDSGDNAFPS